MCLGVCLSSYGMKSMFPVVHDSERGSRTNALTIGRLAFLEALGSKASRTYAEWHERPAKRSVGHFKQGFFFKVFNREKGDASCLTLWKCTAFCIGAHMVKKSSSGCAVSDTTKRKRDQLTGTGGCPPPFRKACRANGRTRLQIGHLP